jgi:hypothetical protein
VWPRKSGAHFLVVRQFHKKRNYQLGLIQFNSVHQISDRKSTIMAYLYFGTLTGSWPWSIEVPNWVNGFFQHKHKIPDRKSTIHHAVYLNFGTLDGLGVDHRRRWPWVLNWKWSLRWVLSNESNMSNSDTRNSSYAWKIVFFLVRVLVKARFPDSQATDPKSRTIDHCRWTDLYLKFQLSRCYSGWEIGGGRTKQRFQYSTFYYKPFIVFDRF